MQAYNSKSVCWTRSCELWVFFKRLLFPVFRSYNEGCTEAVLLCSLPVWAFHMEVLFIIPGIHSITALIFQQVISIHVPSTRENTYETPTVTPWDKNPDCASANWKVLNILKSQPKLILVTQIKYNCRKPQLKSNHFFPSTVFFQASVRKYLLRKNMISVRKNCETSFKQLQLFIGG